MIAVLNNVGQNLSTWINQRANPATLGIMGYSGIGFSFFLDIALFNLSFSTLEIVGVGICLAFSLLTAIYKHITTTKKKVEPPN